MKRLRKLVDSAILLGLSIRRKFLEIDTSTKVFRPRKMCSAPGASRPGNLEKRTCGIRPQGNSLRRVPVCGTGWSRNSTSRGAACSAGGQRVRRRPVEFCAGRTGRLFASFRYRANLASVPPKLRCSLCDCQGGNFALRVRKSLQRFLIVKR